MSQKSPNTTLTHVIYALHAASFFLFFTGIIAVIINYVKRSDVRGTWLESHFKWQIRTFWWGLLWGILGAVGTVIYIGFLILLVAGIWYIYRIIRGWLRLNDGLEMYVPKSKAIDTA